MFLDHPDSSCPFTDFNKNMNRFFFFLKQNKLILKFVWPYKNKKNIKKMFFSPKTKQRLEKVESPQLVPKTRIIIVCKDDIILFHNNE